MTYLALLILYLIWFAPAKLIVKNYLYRWYVIPRNKWRNVYIHLFIGSDEADRHDHPWDSWSYCLWGEMYEHVGPIQKFIKRGMIVRRTALHTHRLEILGKFAVTIFVTGPERREWGFYKDGEWVHWKDHEGDPSRTGWVWRWKKLRYVSQKL